MSDRSRRRPAVEALETRAMLAAGTSPTNPVPVHPEPITNPTPQQLGAAYRQVVAIQAQTLNGIAEAHRRLYAAFDPLAARANPSSPRDRRILQQAAALKSSVEDGLVVARGDEDQVAYTDKIYIPQRLFTTLNSLVRQAQTTGNQLVRSANRATDNAIRRLDVLGGQLGGVGPGR